MTSHIYIVTDGVNTKIGITTDIAKRMSTYKTHNPTSQLVKKYRCSDDEAKRVETAIKIIFKDQLAGSGKEWFSVTPDLIERYVSNLLDKPISSSVLPSLHGVRLTQEAAELKEKLAEAVKIRDRSSIELKEQLAELFGFKFGLGIPEHNLPEDILLKNNLGVDINHSLTRKESNLVKESIATNIIQMPCDDHVWRFFHLAHLASGHSVAICTAKVSMPYLKRMDAEKEKNEIVKFASDLGKV